MRYQEVTLQIAYLFYSLPVYLTMISHDTFFFSHLVWIFSFWLWLWIKLDPPQPKRFHLPNSFFHLLLIIAKAWSFHCRSEKNYSLGFAFPFLIYSYFEVWAFSLFLDYAVNIVFYGVLLVIFVLYCFYQNYWEVQV